MILPFFYLILTPFTQILPVNCRQCNMGHMYRIKLTFWHAPVLTSNAHRFLWMMWFMILAGDSVTMDNTWWSMFWCVTRCLEGLMCSQARWVPGDWAALGQGWSPWLMMDQSEASIRQLLTNQKPVSGVWAPLVSRATDHHHQKPLISSWSW